MNAFERLDYEHQLILPVLRLARTCAQRMAQPGAVADLMGQELIGFLGKFISQCHQVKEFNLFIRLLQKGRSYVIAPITNLHAENSELARIAESLDSAWGRARQGQAGACELVAGCFEAYAVLMEAHILKEDRFYRVIDTILDTIDLLDLKATFDQIEQETLGLGGHEHYRQWALQFAGATGADERVIFPGPSNSGPGEQAVWSLAVDHAAKASALPAPGAVS
jgi:hemerythrin-like domain-containing protein